MKARVHVTLKAGVLDPQGEAIRQALGGMGYGGVDAVRQGKVFDLDLDLSSGDRADARRMLEEMCERLLANTVIERYEVTLLDDA